MPLRILGWLVVVAGLAGAEQLPIKTYTTADGLAQDFINRIVRDSRGFLWLCTGEGLSRFDGYRFTNYTTDEGLPNRWVSDLLEASDGSYWVATRDGLCRFNPAGANRFTVYHPAEEDDARHVEALAEDRNGVIWCGTQGGLYRLDHAAGEVRFEVVDIGMPGSGEGRFVQSLAVDRHGTLWIGTRASGLYRRWPDGHAENYSTAQGMPGNRVEALLEDRSGRLWAATADGLGLLLPSPEPNHTTVARVYGETSGLPTNWTQSLFQSADGKVWVGTDQGLSEFLDSAGKRGPQFRNYTVANGLSSPYVQALAEDRDGNLWLGTDSGGAMKLARSGFTSYTEADGLAVAGVDAVFEDRAGELCVISSGYKHFINCFDGRRFKSVWPAFPSQITTFGWGYNQVTFQDHGGEWWVPTSQGLCRFPAVSRVEQLAFTAPKALYTRRDGLPADNVFRLYEDSHGDIWISTVAGGEQTLSRWMRATGTVHTYPEGEGIASPRDGPPDAFAEDAAGSLWIGGWVGGLARIVGGRFTTFTEADGLPAGAIRSLFIDHSHRLWIAASRGGLARLDDTTADSPHFVIYTTAEGLSSNDVWCMTEDLLGRIYVGTGRGLDRLTPETGDVKHYTAAEGLMHGKVTSAFRDRHGMLWFASNVHGLSRFTPGPEPPQQPPPILISGLRIAGQDHPLSQLGETEVPLAELAPGQNHLSIDFVGLSFGAGEVLRYQYQLEGADQNWSPPSDRRSVNYANLAPGRYRFKVQAVNDEGLASAVPATVAFTILPPVWRRWWFLTVAAGAAGLAIYGLHRGRVARLIELERVRTRIATDLHDDIGANLSLIAMLSEVAREQIRRDDARMKEWFSTIAATSRDTVDSMSDIVWAVNPKRDHLRDLTQRMRRFAEDICGPRSITLDFQAPDLDRELKLGADLRREVFLIFKESINNAVRHSGCTLANVELRVERGRLQLAISDNGRGLVATGDGNGLSTMQLRASRIGGTLEVSSCDGKGTNVRLSMPLDHH